MKTARLFIVSELLLVLTLVCLFSAWKGNVGFNFGWPVAQCNVSIIGKAGGGWVAMAYVCLLASAATFLIGIFGAMMPTKTGA